MPANAQSLRFKRTIQTSPTEVFRAFTNAAALRAWFCHASQADPHKGGRVYLWWNDGYHTAGEFATLTPGKRVAFTWRGRGDPEATQVQVSLTEQDGRTTVTVTHAGVSGGKAWAKSREAIARRWESGLENLQSVLESGVDMRLALRPMLGISVGEFNPEVAAKMGLPVLEGVRLDDVVEGMGAQAAGLQKDDVIVKLGGKKITGWTSLAGALDKHRAGDEVALVLYRGGEKKTATMVLSRRPMPEVPPTLDALAGAVRSLSAEVIAGLEVCFEGVSEAEASHRPAPGEWNAKETVAHLIAGERDTHVWITGLATGEEPEVELDNLSARNTAIVAAYPTIREILEELRRNSAETVALVAALPPEFESRKGSYWRLGFNLLQPAHHAKEHFKQIREAIEAARSQ